MTEQEYNMLTVLYRLREAIQQNAPQMQLKTLDALKEPIGQANKVIKGYRREIQQDIVDTLNAALEAPNNSVTMSNF